MDDLSDNSIGYDSPIGDRPSVTADEYLLATGETLEQTVDVANWKKGIDALRDFDRLEREIVEAEVIAADARQAIRDNVLPFLTEDKNGVGTGIWQMTEEQIAETQRTCLAKGLVEGVDGNVHAVTHMALQIVQIAVVGVGYGGSEESFAHRIFKKEIKVQAGEDIVAATMRLLDAHGRDRDGSSRVRRVSEMMQRGVMTLVERTVLTDQMQAPWRIGHGNPLPYELLTGSGDVGLIKASLPVLQRMYDRGQFVFVPSETTDQLLRTIGQALEPREYAVVQDASAYLKKISQGHFRGQWREVLEGDLRTFLDEAGPNTAMGVYRASAYAPPQIFYSRMDQVHEAARIAMADSSYMDHRGFPLLIELADNMCRTYFGAHSLERPASAVATTADAPFRYLPERSTR